MDCRERPWSDLPQELLSAIADYLTSNRNVLDTLSFRSVCHSWRSSCPPFSQLSILSSILPLSTDRPYPPLLSPSPHYSTASNLSVTIIYMLCRPDGAPWIPRTWIIFVDEYESGKVKIRFPFSKGSYSVPKFFPKSLNLFDFEVHEMGRFYNLSCACYYDDGMCMKLDKPRFRSEDVLKVILFPNGSAAIALFEGGKLGLIKMEFGIYEEEWNVLHVGKGFRFDDIVDYKGRVLGVDRRGIVYEISHSPSEMNPIVRSIAGGDGRRNRLVESLGLLYLVVRFNDCGETNGAAIFKVYELNEKRRKWVEISSIGDRVFVFGFEFSFSALAQELCFRNNCIMFKQHSFRSYKGEVDDKAVFCNSQRHDLYIGVCHLDAPTYVGAIESYPYYSDTLWPPPVWIWPINRLVRLETLDAAIDEVLVKIPENLEAKFQDLAIEGAGASCADFQRHRLELKMQSIAHSSKNILNKLKVTEQTLIMNMSIHMGYQMERVHVMSQTAGLTPEERRDCHDELQRVSWDLSYVVSRQNGWIFESEVSLAEFSELVSYYYSLPKC